MKSKLTALLLATTFLLTGCFGEFALTRKVYQFHDDLAGDDFMGRFIKNILYWIPGGIVYGFVGFIDSVILNTIEFWTGSNPLAMAEGEYEYQMAYNKGKMFKMMASKNKFVIEELGNEKNKLAFDYNEETKVWSMTKDGESIDMMSYANGKVEYLYDDALALAKN